MPIWLNPEFFHMQKDNTVFNSPARHLILLKSAEWFLYAQNKHEIVIFHIDS